MCVVALYTVLYITVHCMHDIIIEIKWDVGILHQHLFVSHLLLLWGPEEDRDQVVQTPFFMCHHIPLHLRARTCAYAVRMRISVDRASAAMTTA